LALTLYSPGLDALIPAQTNTYLPSFIDIVLEGYYVPEKAFDLWKGAQI
jgi:hypothetical protein